jgi:hypothetical protein
MHLKLVWLWGMCWWQQQHVQWWGIGVVESYTQMLQLCERTWQPVWSDLHLKDCLACGCKDYAWFQHCSCCILRLNPEHCTHPVLCWGVQEPGSSQPTLVLLQTQGQSFKTVAAGLRSNTCAQCSIVLLLQRQKS